MSFTEIVKVIFYGIVEGITEWLPISSTGHLILFESFWPMAFSDEFMEMFRVVIQLGAILAVCVLYFKKLNPFMPSHTEEEKKDIFGIWQKVVIGCIPAGVCGMLFNDFFDEHFYKWPVVAAMLIIFGILFIIVERRNSGTVPKVKSFRKMTWRMALLIGTAQVLALIPGTSRSGVTILAGILFGVKRSVAAEYSFFMAIPVMFGASAVKLLRHGLAFSGPELACLLLGMGVAFAVSMAAIKFMMGYIRKRDFQAFGVYRIVLGVLVILYFGIGAAV